MSRNIVLQANGVSVTASLTDSAVSKPFDLPQLGPAFLKVVLSDAIEAAGITFKLQDSHDNGATFQAVGDQSQVSLVKKTFTAGADADVDAATDIITVTSHGWLTGRAVILRGTTVPTGLAAATTYYVIKIDANTLKLAATQAAALAATAVDITGVGTGSCTLVQADYEIRMIQADATDLAQMPFWSPLIVVCTTGSGDSCAVSAIYLSE